MLNICRLRNLLGICLLSILSSSGFGEALFVDYFEYENGELSEVSSNGWIPTLSDDANPSLDVVGGQLAWDFTQGAGDPVNNGYYAATFSESGINSGSLYVYFDLEVQEAPTGTESTVGRFFSLWNGGNGYRARCWIGTAVDLEGNVLTDRFRIGLTEAAGSRVDVVWYPGNWAEGTKLTILLKNDYTLSAASLYVNPLSELDASITVDDGSSLSTKGVAVRHKDESTETTNIGVFRIDNIAVTQTFGDVAAPPSSPPSHVVISGVPGSGISINWKDNSSNETGFRIERRTAGESDFSILSTVEANRTHFLDAEVQSEIEFTYRIVAVADPELISTSNVSAQSYMDPSPPAPALLSTKKLGPAVYASFVAEPNVSYRVEESVDLSNWSVSKQLQSSSKEEFIFSLEPAESGRLFARVRYSGYSVPPGVIGLTEPFKMPENNYGSEFNLSDFGATSGESSDDDSQAFRTALAAMQYGDRLVVPEGEFHLKSSITIPGGMTIFGAGLEHTILKTSGIDDAFQIAPGSQDITLSGLAIVGEDQLLDHGVFVGEPGGVPPQRIWLNRLRIEFFNRRAIQVRSAKHVKIEACVLLNANQLGGGGFGYGITLNDADNNNNWVTDCVIGPVIRHGVLIQFSAHNNLVENNTCFETTEDAYDLHGEDEYANELRFNLAYWDGDSSTVGSPSGFGIGNTGATHDNSGPVNWIHHNEVRGYQIGIEVIQGSHIQFIDGNLLRDNADSGIKIHNGGGNSVIARGNTISGSANGVQATRAAGLILTDNTISGNNTGIVTTSDITDYIIINNDLRGNAAAKELGSDKGEYENNSE